jgi:hypothetical protein
MLKCIAPGFKHPMGGQQAHHAVEGIRIYANGCGQLCSRAWLVFLQLVGNATAYNSMQATGYTIASYDLGKGINSGGGFGFNNVHERSVKNEGKKVS